MVKIRGQTSKSPNYAAKIWLICNWVNYTSDPELLEGNALLQLFQPIKDDIDLNRGVRVFLFRRQNNDKRFPSGVMS